ncbi:MAG: hypothetical protein WCK07_10665 [Betaproteobacteria bacterium]
MYSKLIAIECVLIRPRSRIEITQGQMRLGKIVFEFDRLLQTGFRLHVLPRPPQVCALRKQTRCLMIFSARGKRGIHAGWLVRGNH